MRSGITSGRCLQWLYRKIRNWNRTRNMVNNDQRFNMITKKIKGLALCICAFLFAQAAPAQQKQPNIIFIIADDLGYGNLTAYNPQHKVPTPNIDRLAKEGTKFTRF